MSLGDEKDHLKFVLGIYFSPLTATNTVPHLQCVFQVDAAHMKFGKYTLISLYGTTANKMMFPVALAIVFDNENTDAWDKLWKYTVNLHPTLNQHDMTIITYQCLGSIQAIKKHVPNVMHFHRSYHRLSDRGALYLIEKFYEYIFKNLYPEGS